MCFTWKIIWALRQKLKYKQPQYNAETLAAMEEARRISRDPNVPSYSSMEDLKKALLQDWCTTLSSRMPHQGRLVTCLFTRGWYSHIHIRTFSNCHINQPPYTHHKILYRILQHICTNGIFWLSYTIFMFALLHQIARSSTVMVGSPAYFLVWVWT